MACRSNDLRLWIVVRHRSTPFGYNDAMWAKYAMPIATRSKVEDPKSKLAPKINIFNSGTTQSCCPIAIRTLDSLFKQGLQLAVCGTSTRGYAGAIAQAVGGGRQTHL